MKPANERISAMKGVSKRWTFKTEVSADHVMTLIASPEAEALEKHCAGMILELTNKIVAHEDWLILRGLSTESLESLKTSVEAELSLRNTFRKKGKK